VNTKKDYSCIIEWIVGTTEDVSPDADEGEVYEV
jgi:hypothetical protein